MTPRVVTDSVAVSMIDIDDMTRSLTVLVRVRTGLFCIAEPPQSQCQ